MRQSIRRLIQYWGLIIAGTLLFNGAAHNPLASEDDSPTAAAVSASLLNIREPGASTKAAVTENYGKLPLCFEANNGQVDEAVKFLAKGNGYTLIGDSSEKKQYCRAKILPRPRI